MNKGAFLWGRRTALQPAGVRRHAGVGADFRPLHAVDQIVADRHARLIDYQNREYADRYRTRVEQIGQLDAKFGRDDLTRAVARNLYRLMAAKDEYEVARLFTDGQFKSRLAEVFERDYSVSYHLAPPSLTGASRSGANPRKRAFPAVTRTLFRGLAKLKACVAPGLIRSDTRRNGNCSVTTKQCSGVSQSA